MAQISGANKSEELAVSFVVESPNQRVTPEPIKD